MTTHRWVACAAAISFWPIAQPAAAQTHDDRGRESAERADRHLRGYGDLAADVTITLETRGGTARTWRVRLLSLEAGGAGGGEKTIVVFQEPRDVRGTALLTVTAPGSDDEQWLYLPAVGRLKRIASHNRASSFMGTEFSYEDIATQPLDKYRFRYLRDDTLSGVATSVVERYPVDTASSYSRQVLWLDRDHHRPLRVDFYDRADALLKTLHFRGYQLHAGRFWRAGEMEMVNHRTQASTMLRWNEYRFGTGLRDRDFEPVALNRVP